MTQAHVDMTKVVLASLMRGEDDEETAGLKKLLEEATSYINRFDWHRGVKASYYGLGVAGSSASSSSRSNPRARTWTIKSGSSSATCRPAYITTEESPNPATALDAYIGAIEDWVKAAKAGRSVEGLIPVNVPPTPEDAARLESRLASSTKRYCELRRGLKGVSLRERRRTASA